MANTRIYEVQIYKGPFDDNVVIPNLRVSEVQAVETALNAVGYEIARRIAGKNGTKVLLFAEKE